MSLSFLELFDISERYIELVNPTSPEKILEIGRVAGMAPGQKIIDFGCGYAEPLVLWAKNFGVSGIGIDFREKTIERARRKIDQNGLAKLLQVELGNGADYSFPAGSFDYATCIGASFIWDNIEEALQTLISAIQPHGKIILGEPYWLKDAVPPDLAQAQPEFHSEIQLYRWVRQAGLDFEYVLHSTVDEWDRYEAGNWRGLVAWMKENPAHPDFGDVERRLHESQEEYFQYGREYFGWALYLLTRMEKP